MVGDGQRRIYRIKDFTGLECRQLDLTKFMINWGGEVKGRQSLVPTGAFRPKKKFELALALSV